MQANEFDLKKLQSKREERFRSSLFSSTEEKLVQNLSNDNFVQIYVKCNITPDLIVTKEDKGSNQEIEYLSDEVIESEQLGMKKEFNVFVDRDLVSQINLLKSNYHENSDQIKVNVQKLNLHPYYNQIPVCGACGIRLPEDSDFNLYFDIFKNRQNVSACNAILQQQDLKNLFGLLICGSIFSDEQAQELAFKELTKNITIEILFKILIVVVQYESSKYTFYIYKLIKQFFYWKAGLLKDINDPFLKQVIASSKHNLSIKPPNYVQITTNNYIIKINTTFLFPLYKQIEMQRLEFMRPLAEYSPFQVLRNADIMDEYESSEFPHIYQIKDEKDQKLHLVAVQFEEHSEILIFQTFVNLSELADKYTKYDDNFVGMVDRNIWGTQFRLYDDGYPEEQASSFPEWIGSIRKKIMQIEYETNIMASEPRKFDIAFQNFKTKKFESNDTLKYKFDSIGDIITKIQQGEGLLLTAFLRKSKSAISSEFLISERGRNRYSTIIAWESKEILGQIIDQVERNVFNLDFRPPLNIIQAFTISMCSISSKVLVS